MKHLKKLLLSLSIILTIFAYNFAQASPSNTSLTTETVYAARHKSFHHRISIMVYIASKHGKKYHFSPTCHGLNNAKHDIKKISLKKAKKLGYTKCKFEKR